MLWWPNSSPMKIITQQEMLSTRFWRLIGAFNYRAVVIQHCNLFTTDERSFHGAVVKHILHILQRHEHVQTGHTQWVLDEALNPKHLQFGGTFTNVLVRKIEETLIPILAEIIAAVDFNYNLNLLRIQPVQEELHSRIHSLWISMFRDVCQFDVGAHQGDQVPGVGGHFSEIVFRCKLPFSWIIKDKVENEWSYAQSSAGKKCVWS